MYICKDCGKLYEDEEAEDVYATTRYYNLVAIDSCACGGELVRAKRCQRCDEFMPEDSFSLCDSCVEEYETLENALEIGTDYEEKVSLNGFFTSVFTKEEIESILLETFKAKDEKIKKNAIKQYCEDDYSYFMGLLIRNGKRENSLFERFENGLRKLQK